MTKSEESVRGISLETLTRLMRASGVERLLAKPLSPNDNSKNQTYLAGSLDVVNIIPVGRIEVDPSQAGQPTMKAALPLSWLRPDGVAVPAPHAKLILYPKYPEVRLSGFLRGCDAAPSALMTTRTEGRILFLGITGDRRVVGWVASPGSAVAVSFEALRDPESLGVFTVVPLAQGASNSCDVLVAELARIHRKGWIESHSLDAMGARQSCRASNCVGYTLEAELGVRRNGMAAPDFLGWEVKAAQTSNYLQPAPAKALTLFTPEPTAGYYRSAGFDAFIRKYGYADRRGRADRINFGGVFRADDREPNTGLTLRLEGFEKASTAEDIGRITDPCGRLSLVAMDGEIAAAWDFAGLLDLWNRKHAQAVYVPAERRTGPSLRYRYAPRVLLARGTDFTRFLSSVARGSVFLDPGMKLVGASTGSPQTKRRSQFRIKFRDLGELYAGMELRAVAT